MMTQGIDWRISYALFCVAMLLLGSLTALVLKKTNFGANIAKAPKKVEHRHETNERL